MRILLLFVTLLAFLNLNAYKCAECSTKNTKPHYIIDENYQIGNIDRSGHVSLTNIKMDKTNLYLTATISASPGKRSYKFKPELIYLSKGDQKIQSNTSKTIVLTRRMPYKDLVLAFTLPKNFKLFEWTINFKDLKFCYTK